MDPTHADTRSTPPSATLTAATAGKRRLQDDDGGATWTKLAGGLPTATPTRASACVPRARRPRPSTYTPPSASVQPTSTACSACTRRRTAARPGRSSPPRPTTWAARAGTTTPSPSAPPTRTSSSPAARSTTARAIGTYYALAGSQDGGATFQDYSIGAGGARAAHRPARPDLHRRRQRLLDGNDGGVWRLENPSTAGSTSTTDNSANIQWTDLNTNLDTIQFTGIALHPTDPKIAYGGSQDNGTEKYTGSRPWPGPRWMAATAASRGWTSPTRRPSTMSITASRWSAPTTAADLERVHCHRRRGLDTKRPVGILRAVQAGPGRTSRA